MNNPMIMTKIIEEDLLLSENTELINQNGMKAFLVTLKVDELHNLFGNQFKYLGAESKEANLERFQQSVDFDYVKDVTKWILQGNFLRVGSDISINILNTSGKELNYDSESKVLTIFRGAEIGIIEGQQVYLGIENALKENPKVDLKLGIKVLYSDLNGLHKYFVQRAKEI